MKNISVDFFSLVNQEKIENLLNQQQKKPRDILFEDPNKKTSLELYDKIQTVLSDDKSLESTKLNKLKRLKHNLTTNLETSKKDSSSKTPEVQNNESEEKLNNKLHISEQNIHSKVRKTYLGHSKKLLTFLEKRGLLYDPVSKIITTKSISLPNRTPIKIDELLAEYINKRNSYTDPDIISSLKHLKNHFRIPKALIRNKEYSDSDKIVPLRSQKGTGSIFINKDTNATTKKRKPFDPEKCFISRKTDQSKKKERKIQWLQL